VSIISKATVTYQIDIKKIFVFNTGGPLPKPN